jgi:hypothetical protein
MQQGQYTVARQDQHGGILAGGVMLFAVVVMSIIGIFETMIGSIAFLSYAFFEAPETYPFRFSGTTWGLIHLTVGVVVAIAAMALFSGAVWARIVGVVVAGISAITNFLAMPNHPVWSLLIIIMAILVIWALTFHGRSLVVEENV